MIVAYTGLPGSGKTYLMTRDILDATKRRRREAWVNFPLVGAHYYDDFRLVMKVTKGIVAADELNALAHAHDWHKLDPRLLSLWSQSRKLGIDFWYTTQGFHMVNNQIRQLTNYVWKCRHMFGTLHVAHLYDACDVERDRQRAKIYKTRHFLISKDTYSAYNTMFKIKPLNMAANDFEPEQLPVFDGSLELPEMPQIDWGEEST
jgi:hypothetical protein